MKAAYLVRTDREECLVRAESPQAIREYCRKTGRQVLAIIARPIETACDHEL